jgi:hypothetical protein
MVLKIFKKLNFPREEKEQKKAVKKRGCGSCKKR